MGSAVLSGLLVSSLVLLLGWGSALSNADFIYMCSAADVLKHGTLPVTPYFPPGYPALLWLAMQGGLSALSAGMLWSAMGTGLSSGVVTFMARRWGLPAAVALALGLLAASLPSVFEIALNPHLDALYTGLALLLVALGLCAVERPLNVFASTLAVISVLLLLTLRWHAPIVVLPIALVLLFTRTKGSRALALALLSAALVALGWVWWGLYVTEGKLTLATGHQIAVGQALRDSSDVEAARREIFSDYAAWLATHPSTARMIEDGIVANYAMFVSRRAILLGLMLCLLGGIAARRIPPGALLLVLFIAGYALAVSPTYFTPRTSALTELCGVLLAASGLSVLLNWQQSKDKRRLLNLRVDPALAGMLLSGLLLVGVAYNGWREAAMLGAWRARRAELIVANEVAWREAGGNRLALYGPLDLTGWTHNVPLNLPGATYSRLWMDDPDVWPLVYEQLPRYEVQEVLALQTPVRAVLLWPGLDSSMAGPLELALAGSPQWTELDSGSVNARLFVRRNVVPEVSVGGERPPSPQLGTAVDESPSNAPMPR